MLDFFSSSLSSPWGQKESDMTEQLTLSLFFPTEAHLLKNLMSETFLVVQWLRLCAPNARDPDSIPNQGSRYFMPKLKDPECCNEIQCSQINTFFNFIYFWLCQVFIAARVCSLVLESGAWMSHHGGFSRCGACALGTRASVVAVPRLSS